MLERLKRAAGREIRLLRKHATEEELGRLELTYLSPSSPRMCIYGQMTGDCYSNRASKLLGLCAVPVKPVDGTSLRDGKLLPTDEWKREPSKFQRTDHSIYRPYFSALEIYIAKKGAKNKNVISYLRGETDTLEL